MYKNCSVCLINKAFFEFSVNKRNKDGRENKCKFCIKQITKQKYKNNPERHKKYNLNNSELRNSYHKNYRIINRKRLSAVKSFRLRTDPEFKIMTNCRKRIWSALTYIGKKKKLKTIDLIGCNIEFLRKYLEDRFLPGMNWGNYTIDGWHIDHIKACFLFDLTNEDEQKKCFHYSNLQPLWASDNIRKSNNIVNY